MIPVSVFLSSLVSHLLGLALMVAAAGVFLNQISIFVLLLPVYILLIGFFAVGIGWIVGQPACFPAGHGAGGDA